MIYTLPNATNRRNRVTGWALAGVFSITFCTLVAHKVSHYLLTERLDVKAELTALLQLEARIATLEQAEVSAPNAAGVNYTDLNELNDSLNERIAELATAMMAVASQSEVEALQIRLQRVEKDTISPVAPPSPAKSKKPAAKAKKILHAPLEILGQELRGGERFLSVGPLGTQSLEQCRLIRIGEVYSGWKLDEVDEKAATFSFEGVTHRLSFQ
jgi:hypothetical protein